MIENTNYSVYIMGIEDIPGNVMNTTGVDFIFIPPSIEDGLTGYWRFDEMSGTIANDATPYGFNGQINGAIWTTDAISGGALEFDGTNTVDLGTGEFEIPSTNEFTISLWMKFDNAFSGHLIRRGQYVYPYRIYASANKIFTTVRTSGTNYMYSSIIPEQSSWYHCVLIYGNGERQLYVNGQLDNSSPLEGTLNFLANQSTVLGFEFRGMMDEVQIYNRALSATDVEALYSQFAP